MTDEMTPDQIDESELQALTKSAQIDDASTRLLNATVKERQAASRSRDANIAHNDSLTEKHNAVNAYMALVAPEPKPF